MNLKIEITHGRYLGTKEAELYEEKKILFFTIRVRKDFYRAMSCDIHKQIEAWRELFNVPKDNIKDLTEQS